MAAMAATDVSGLPELMEEAARGDEKPPVAARTLDESERDCDAATEGERPPSHSPITDETGSPSVAWGRLGQDDERPLAADTNGDKPPDDLRPWIPPRRRSRGDASRRGEA